VNQQVTAQIPGPCHVPVAYCVLVFNVEQSLALIALVLAISTAVQLVVLVMRRFKTCTMAHSFGICLPITTRGLHRVEVLLENLQHFRDSLLNTVPNPRASIRLFVAIDDDDAGLCTLGTSQQIAHTLKQLLSAGSATGNRLPEANVTIRIFSHAEHGITGPGQVCRYWRALSQQAFEAGCQYTVLLGDDVDLMTYDWCSHIEQQFQRVSVAVLGAEHADAAFGCVAFRCVVATTAMHAE
jgi:hypothetical protein